MGLDPRSDSVLNKQNDEVTHYIGAFAGSPEPQGKALQSFKGARGPKLLNLSILPIVIYIPSSAFFSQVPSLDSDVMMRGGSPR